MNSNKTMDLHAAADDDDQELHRWPTLSEVHKNKNPTIIFMIQNKSFLKE